MRELVAHGACDLVAQHVGVVAEVAPEGVAEDDDPVVGVVTGRAVALIEAVGARAPAAVGGDHGGGFGGVGGGGGGGVARAGGGIAPPAPRRAFWKWVASRVSGSMTPFSGGPPGSPGRASSSESEFM